MVKKIDVLEVILKVAECCNIACDYCYYFEKSNQDYLDKPRVIRKETVENLAKYFKEAIISHQIEFLRIDIHGGEPLMMGKKRFREMLIILTSELGQLCTLEFALQTNGTMIDDEWVDIFSKYQVAASVSLDGNKTTHDLHRIDRHGKGTYSAAVAGLTKLNLASQQNKVPVPGVICVIDPEKNNAREVYRHFIDNLAIRNLFFIEPDMTIDELNQTKVAQISDYLLNLYQEWETDNSPKFNSDLYVRNFNDPFRDLILASTPSEKPQKIMYVVITIRSDGSINPDDCLRNTHIELFNSKYTIHNSTLNDYITSDEIKDLYKDIFLMPEECQECGIKKLCRNGFGYGSLIHRYSKDNQMRNKNALCEVYKNISLNLCKHVINKGKTWETIKDALY